MKTQERVETEHGDFSIAFEETSAGRYEGAVYPVTHWTRVGTDASGWAYESKTSGGETHDAVNDDCRVLFEFSFCWRGVWEGRLYFKDEEYWGEELRTMADLWERIQAQLKTLIRQSKPAQLFED